MDYRVIVRDRGRRDSLRLLLLAGLFGFAPVVAFFTNAGTAIASLVFGAVLGIPVFALSVWRLTHMEALALSGDGKSLGWLKRDFRGRTRIDIPIADVKSIGLGGACLCVTMKAGGPLEMEVEGISKADSALRDLAHHLGVPYYSGPDIPD